MSVAVSFGNEHKRETLVVAACALAVGVLFLAVASPALGSGLNGTIKGYVTDASTGSAVADAFVRIEGDGLSWAYELTTDAFGYFEVSAVPQTYNLIIVAPEYQPHMAQVGVGSLETIWANASLSPAAPRTALIQGYVSDASTSAPVTTGRVVAVDMLTFQYINLSNLDVTGYYEIGLVPGDYTLFTDSVLNYSAFSTMVSLAAGEVEWLNFTLLPNPFDSYLNGTVYDASTLTPLAGATVSVNADVNDLFLPEATTNASGGYSIAVPSGFVTVTANLVGFGPDTEFLSISPTTNYTLDLYLRPIVGSLRGYVTDGDTGSPLPNATVSASDFDGYYDQAVSDATGYYEIPVPDGWFDAQASAVGYFPSFTGTFVGPGEIYWLNFTLVPLPPIVATVQGYVVDASDGSYVSNMTVVAVDFATGFMNVTVSNGTGFYSAGVIESVFLLVFVPAQGNYAGGSALTSTSPGDVRWVNVTIYPRNATVRVHVTDGLTGLPVPGATANLYWGFTYSVFNTTDSGGYTDFASPSLSGVSLNTWAPGYYSEYRTLTVAPGFNLVAIVLYPILPFDVLVRGYVTESGTGNPIWGAQVQASSYPYSAVTNWTDPSGYYEMLIVAQPQTVRATVLGYAANETTVDPNPGETLWANLTLDFDPVPPEFVSFTATPAAGVHPANPTSLVADILEKSLDEASVGMSLLRMMNSTGPTGTFLLVQGVDPVDLSIVQTAPGEYAISTTWDARGYGGWIGNATISEWWPATVGFFPSTDVVVGYWSNGTIPSPDFSMALFDQATGDLVLVFSFTYGPITAAGQPISTFMPAGQTLEIDLTTGWILGAAPMFGQAYPLAGLRFTRDDVVPSGLYAALLQLADTAGNWNRSVTFLETDTAPPVASAGPDQVVDEDTLVTFDGSGSTDDVGIVNYTWTFVDGGPHTLYEVNPTYVFATPGTYVVTMTVVDAGGHSATDTVTVIVRDVTAPNANAGPDQVVDEDTLVTFDASASADNVGMLNYTWTFTDVAAQTLYGVSPTYVFATPGTYVVTVRVRDAAGNTGMDTMTVVVRDVTAPVANAGQDRTVDEDTTVLLDAGGSTDNVGVVNYTWTFEDVVARTLYEVDPTYVFTTPGSYVITLAVRDAAGNSATDTLTVVVADVTNPMASLTSPASGETVSGTIAVTSTALDNVGVVRVELYVDGALVASDSSAPYEFLLNTADYADGSHILRVTAYDAAGNSASSESTVTFSNAAPPGGLGVVGYGLILTLVIVGAILVAWMLVRRRKRPAPPEPVATTAPAHEPAEEAPGRERDDGP